MESYISESSMAVWNGVTLIISVVSLFIWLSGMRKGWIPSQSRVHAWEVTWTRFFLLLWLVFALAMILPFALWDILGFYGSESPGDAFRLWETFFLNVGMQVAMIAVLVCCAYFTREWFPGVLSGIQGLERNRRWMRTTILRFFQFLPLVLLASLAVNLAYEKLGIVIEPQEVIILMMRIDDPLLWVVAVFSTVVFAPLAEELVFRGVVYRFLKSRFRPELAVIVSAALFSVIHIELSVLLPLFVLGIVLALVYEETGDIRAPILFHGIFNLQTMGLILLDRFVLNAGSSLLP
ncbi:MAG: CPBP family intramembrane metalloprotease [Opitutales bacterium]|nr:CPBP family intramembrane metalloprotease [Opitutales bacterium]